MKPETKNALANCGTGIFLVMFFWMVVVLIFGWLSVFSLSLWHLTIK